LNPEYQGERGGKYKRGSERGEGKGRKGLMSKKVPLYCLRCGKRRKKRKKKEKGWRLFST